MGQEKEVVVLQGHSEARLDIHSVEISKNAKGEYSFSIKCYGTSVVEACQRATLALETVEEYLDLSGRISIPVNTRKALSEIK
jgi:hypothetical protein